MSDELDAALVSACRAGDRRAFEQLLQRYQRPIFNAAFRILNHREDATDVTQTVFLKTYEHLHQFDPSQRFFSWIYRIAINEAADVAARRQRSEPVGDGLDTLPTESSGPEQLAAEIQSDTAIQGALMAIKQDYRALIVLKHVQECSYEEIAEILECPVKTVKSRLFTAREALRAVMLSRGLT